MLVQVGHGGYEPAFRCLSQVHLRGIGVHDGGQLIRRLQEAGAVSLGGSIRLLQPLGQVQPVLCRHVQCPGVLKARVVEDHVHHHLQAFSMCLVAQAAVVIVSAEARVYAIVVGGSIAMVGRIAPLIVWRVVLQHGCQPQCRHAQFLEIVQMFTDAVQVAAMTQAGLRTVFLVGAHTLYLRVVTCALSKAVGHQHVEHIGIGKAYALVATHLALLELIGDFLLVELEAHRASLCLTKVHVHQQVVG